MSSQGKHCAWIFKDDLVSLASSCVYWQPAACCHAAGVQAEENINNTVGRQHMLFQKKKRRKKSLKCSSPILWEFHMETEHNKRINHINYYFCGKPSLFPDAFSSAIFHCNSLPLTKVSGSLQGLACSWPFWMLPSCRKGVPGPPYLCFAVTKRQL